MTEQLVMELLRGSSKLFLHPLFYLSFVVVFLVGYLRIQRERRDFHVRIYDMYQELRFLLPIGIVLGVVGSLITLGIGVSIPFSAIVVMGAITFILMISSKLRLVSAAYTIGTSYLILVIMDYFQWEFSVFNVTVTGHNVEELVGMTVLLALLLIIEGLIIQLNGAKQTSPQFTKSTRGLTVGTHISKRLWLLPMFLLIPGEGFSLPFDWWPIATVGEQSFLLILLPFPIGFYQRIQSTLPKRAIKETGKQVFWLGGFVGIAAASGYVSPTLSALAVAVAIVGREWVALKQRSQEDNRPYFFSPQDKGMMVLGVIPNSPADKLGLTIGEVIEKVNGFYVKDEQSFYDALQKNRAYCKIEVLDINQQIRFVKGALYEGDHHELGILFPKEDKQWEQAERA
ncbi:PDZ domain-containing protein [Bacillus spongiae]|uniref:PDZ domain-containing protein n=1 Tax=Bacillus spongiae TaxID=2683610 RepID=A0ABU8HEI8_9BACI